MGYNAINWGTTAHTFLNIPKFCFNVCASVAIFFNSVFSDNIIGFFNNQKLTHSLINRGVCS